MTVLSTAVFGYLLVVGENTRERESTGLRAQVRRLKAESVKLRLANQMLKIKVAKQKLQPKLPAARKTPPPKSKVVDHVFPVGKAIAIIREKIFVTLARMEGERARIRIASIREGDKGNRSRSLLPGQTWRFKVGKISYALVFHSRKSNPPGARLSIRRLNP